MTISGDTVTGNGGLVRTLNTVMMNAYLNDNVDYFHVILDSARPRYTSQVRYLELLAKPMHCVKSGKVDAVRLTECRGHRGPGGNGEPLSDPASGVGASCFK